MTKLRFKLENEGGVYGPGEPVKGLVVVSVKNMEKVETLYVEMIGESETHWTEGSGEDETSFGSKIRIFNFKQVFLVSNKDNKNQPIVLAQGSHSFPFVFTFPLGDHPPSFESSSGHIRYFLKVKLLRKFYPNVKEVHLIKYLGNCNVNLASLQSSVEMQNDKTLGVLCFKSEPLSLSVVFNKTGFVVGDTIIISANVTNNTGRNVRPVAKLIKLITYRSYSNTIESQSCLAKFEGQKSNEKYFSWENVKLKVPSDDYITITNCSNIRLDHYVVVSLKIHGSSNFEVKCPVVIGNVVEPLTQPLFEQPPLFKPLLLYNTPDVETQLNSSDTCQHTSYVIYVVCGLISLLFFFMLFFFFIEM